MVSKHTIRTDRLIFNVKSLIYSIILSFNSNMTSIRMRGEVKPMQYFVLWGIASSFISHAFQSKISKLVHWNVLTNKNIYMYN